MTPRTPTAGRLIGPAVVFLLLLLAGPAQATGTGGVDISPYPGVVDGKQVTAFHAKIPSSGSLRVQYALRNTTNRTATARLFAAKALTNGHGHFTIGPAGSSPYLSFADQQVSLKPRETRIASFLIQAGTEGRPSGKVYGAIVVEVKHGSVIAQAAVVVYLEPGRRVPLPLLIVLIAAGLLALAGLGFLIVVRRRS
jgi:hypothetical protein